MPLGWRFAVASEKNASNLGHRARCARLSLMNRKSICCGPRIFSLGVALTVVAAVSAAWLFSAAEGSPQEPTVSAKQQAFSFAQMCDTQLGMGGYEHDVKTFKLAVKQINRMKPDFVVVCGDLVNKSDDKSFADFNGIREGFKLPCYCAAGNHDVGNKPTAESLKRYREKVGKDYYTVEHKGYTFVIANTQLWKAPLAGESEKHDALVQEDAAGGAGKGLSSCSGCPLSLVSQGPRREGGLLQPAGGKAQRDPDIVRRNRRRPRFSVVIHIAGCSTSTRGFCSSMERRPSKNFDKRPMGFRLWDVSENRELKPPLRETRGDRGVEGHWSEVGQVKS